MSPPVLETARLILRAHTAADLEDSFAIRQDPNVVRYIGGKPLTREETWMRLLRNVGHWTLSGYGFWLARDRTTGRAVGEVGIGDFQRDLDPQLASAFEAGWVLAAWAHGQGFATEAMTAVLAWAEASAVVGARVTCLIDANNTSSVRVADKLGFRHFAHATYNGAPVNLYERIRADTRS